MYAPAVLPLVSKKSSRVVVSLIICFSVNKASNCSLFHSQHCYHHFLIDSGVVLVEDCLGPPTRTFLYNISSFCAIQNILRAVLYEAKQNKNHNSMHDAIKVSLGIRHSKGRSMSFFCRKILLVKTLFRDVLIALCFFCLQIDRFEQCLQRLHLPSFFPQYFIFYIEFRIHQLNVSHFIYNKNSYLLKILKVCNCHPLVRKNFDNEWGITKKGINCI